MYFMAQSYPAFQPQCSHTNASPMQWRGSHIGFLKVWDHLFFYLGLHCSCTCTGKLDRIGPAKYLLATLVYTKCDIKNELTNFTLVLQFLSVYYLTLVPTTTTKGKEALLQYFLLRYRRGNQYDWAWGLWGKAARLRAFSLDEWCLGVGTHDWDAWCE